MNNQEHQDLIDYANLVRSNAEISFTSAMLDSAIRSSITVNRFSTFLLIGSGATVSVFVTNIDKLLPIINQFGFKASALLLVGSILFGIAAKFRSIQCEISIENRNFIQERLPKILEELDKHQGLISTRSSQLNITVDSELRMDRVISDFLKPFPRFIRYIALRNLNKNSDSSQVAYLNSIKHWLSQCFFTLLQTAFFVFFIFSCIYFA